MAVALNSLVIGAGDQPPRLNVSQESVVHMDTSPQPLAASGTPAYPIHSMFQEQAIAIRLILEMAWGVRAAGSVAVVNSVAW
jgi:hypothetical protein